MFKARMLFVGRISRGNSTLDRVQDWSPAVEKTIVKRLPELFLCDTTSDGMQRDPILWEIRDFPKATGNGMG